MLLAPAAAEQLLASHLLGPQQRDRPLELVEVEVGRHVDDVGQRPDRVVIDAALEVDDHDRQVVGMVVDAQRQEQRLQELGLAGSRRAADEAVRAVGDEVDAHRDVARHADRRDAVRRLRAPAFDELVAGDVAQADRCRRGGTRCPSASRPRRWPGAATRSAAPPARRPPGRPRGGSRPPGGAGAGCRNARDRRRRSTSAWRRAPPVPAAGRSSRRRCRSAGRSRAARPARPAAADRCRRR